MAASSEELDQGFNEEELADIMTEIESLESEGSNPQTKLKAVPNGDSEEQSKQAAPEQEDQSENQSDSPHFSSDDLTEETMKSPKKRLDTPENRLQKVIDEEIASAGNSQTNEAAQSPKTEESKRNVSKGVHDSAVTMKVSGKLKLHLQFAVAGKSVSVLVDENEGLTVETPGGGVFKLPINS